MAHPTLHFLYNTGTTDLAYGGSGQAVGDWRKMNTVVGTGQVLDTMVFTGGGILGVLPVPTVASGTRDATIRPSLSSYVIPQTYIEDFTTMYNVPMAGFGGALYSQYRYVFCVYVEGLIVSDLYLEAWDDITFSTYSSEVLQGTANSSNKSFVNAIRTTNSEPPWHPEWSGDDSEAEYLRGSTECLSLKNSSVISDEALYFNIYIRLETDCTTFHNQCCFCFRYLYT